MSETKTVTHRIPALLGPGGELAFSYSHPDQSENFAGDAWDFLWDLIDDWDGRVQNCDVRKVWVNITVPIRNKPVPLEIEASEVEVSDG